MLTRLTVTPVTELWFTLTNCLLLQPPLRSTDFIQSARFSGSTVMVQSSEPQTRLGPQTHPRQSQILGVLKKLEFFEHGMNMGNAGRLWPMCARKPTLFSPPICSHPWDRGIGRKTARNSEISARTHALKIARHGTERNGPTCARHTPTNPYSPLNRPVL